MRKILLLSAAAFAVAATPAVARDGSGYFGIEGGVLFPKDLGVEGEFLFDDPDDPDFLESDVGDLEFKRGLDLDLIAGYDFGAFRVEGELGYKRAKADDFEFDADFLEAIGVDPDSPEANDLDIDGKVRVVSGMINVLGDFGSDAGFGGYAGLGVGRARVKAAGDRDSAWAFQAIAGIRTAVSENVDVGLKYRYFRTGRLNFEQDFGDEFGTGFLGANQRFSSHSLLASLIFNFGAPAVAEMAPPPPPPPPMVEQAPATQTCPDGSVILATSVCPPPPPPPPPPPVERGERGQ